MAIRAERRMMVVNCAIDQIEYVSRDHRRQRHAAPILGQPMDAECFCNKRRVDAEEETVGHCVNL